MKDISTCLWFDHQAEEAANFYQSVFPNTQARGKSHYGEAGAEVSGQKAGSTMAVDIQLENMKVLCLNGGPIFQFTPALSYFVHCGTIQEIDELWKKLSDGGEIRMGLDKYPWAERYGWCADKFGMNWQLILDSKKSKIIPAFLFVDALFGRGQEALDFYLSIFPDSKINEITRDEKSKTVMHAAFQLNGQEFVLMEGSGTHNYTFSHATSLVVNCDTQEELDHYWEKLSAGGSTEQCGWLRDKFGVSWQIVPTALAEIMKNSKKGDEVMKAMLKMTKLDIAVLKIAGTT